jgi:hypothetical protein
MFYVAFCISVTVTTDQTQRNIPLPALGYNAQWTLKLAAPLDKWKTYGGRRAMWHASVASEEDIEDDVVEVRKLVGLMLVSYLVSILGFTPVT